MESNNAINGGAIDLLLNNVKKGEFYITSTSFNMYGFAGVGINLTVDNNASKGLFLNTSGNLGLGVTPSAWNSPFKVMQLGSTTAVWDISSVSGFSNNLYNDGTGRYLTSDFATIFQQWDGGFAWLQAPSGTAGNAISFTQAMTLNASGNLSIGNTNNAYKLDVSGQSVIRANATNGIAFQGIATDGNSAIYFRPNYSGYNLISSNYLSAGPYLPLSLSARENTSDLLLNASGNVSIGNTNDTYKLDVSGTGRFTKPLYLNSASNTAGSQGFLLFNYAASNAGSRSWKLSNDQVDWGDFAIQVSTTQTGSTYITPLNIASTGAATFSSTVQVNGASTGTPLGVKTAANQNWRILDNSGAQFDCVNDALSARVDFRIGAQLYIAASGNVGIGTTSPTSLLTLQGNGVSPVQLSVFSANPNSDILIQSSASTNAVRLRNGADDFQIFTNGSERMRITSGGFLKLREAVTSTTSVHILQADTTSDAVVQVRNLNASNGSDGMLAVVAQRNTTNNSFYAFGYYNLDAGAWRLRIADSGNVTNTNNSYGAISDIRLKENISDTTSKLADLLKVKVKNYNLIGDDKKQIGVIAQELETIFPSMIDTDINTGLKSVKYSVFVPMLIKAIQELNDKIK